MIDVKDLVVDNPNARIIVRKDGSRETVDILRGFSPPPETTPWGHGTAELLQADIRTAVVRAGESIEALDVVNVLSDEAFRDMAAVDNVIGAVGAPSSKTWNYSTEITGIDSGNAYLSGAYYYGSGGGSYSYSSHILQVLDPIKMTGSLIDQYKPLGTRNAVFTLGGQYAINIYWENPNLRLTILNAKTGAYVIDGQLLLNVGLMNDFCAISIDSTRYALISRNASGMQVSVYRFNGTTNTPIFQTPIQPSGMGYPQSCALIDQNRIVLACIYGRCCVVTISETGASAGDSHGFYGGELSTSKCAINSAGDFVVLYKPNTIKSIYFQRMQISGTAITSVGASISMALAEDRYAPCLADIEDTFITVVGNLAYPIVPSKNGLSLETPYTYTTTDSRTPILAKRDNVSVWLLYCPTTLSSYLNMTILSMRGGKIAGSFIDQSRDAIALTSGTGGDAIQVAYSGTVTADGVTEGQRIDSPGVSAYAPRDGWLDVKAEWDGVFTGTYYGNETDATGEGRTIELGFTPKSVDIQSNDDGITSGNYTLSAKINRASPAYGNTARENIAAEIVENGFIVRNRSNRYVNFVNRMYNYTAWR